MTILFGALLFSLSINLDNILIGVGFGASKIKITPPANLFIATITSGCTFLIMLFTREITSFFPTYLIELISSYILICIGSYYIIKTLFSLYATSEESITYAKKSDMDCSGTIDYKEASTVAITLLLNNITLGIIAALSGIHLYYSLLFTFLFSYIFIPIGFKIGAKLSHRYLGKYGMFLTGFILILLGTITFFM